MTKDKKIGSEVLAKNKKAFAVYEILEKIEAGIVLNGGEVKSIRSGKINLKGSFIDVHNQGVWLNNAHISRYKYDTTSELAEARKRKILLHEREMIHLENQLKTKGITAIPLEVYTKKGLIKVLIGVCKGKKLHDRRDDLKKKAQTMDIKRALKNFK
jgi:SsrA-binding protein